MTEIELSGRERRDSEALHHRPSGLHHRVPLQLEGHGFDQHVINRGSDEIEYQGLRDGRTLAFRFRFDPAHPCMWMSTNAVKGPR
jgi:hypothetical protein